MKKLALLVLVVPAAVTAFCFLNGAIGYLTGTASLWSVGYPGPEFGNLDPQYRVHRQTSGCIVMGPELLTHAANNAAVALMTTLFGPMRGTYHGPYPDREQARAALAASQHKLSLEALRAQVHGAQDCAGLRALYPPQFGMPAVRCAEFRESTLVLGFEGHAVLRAREDGAVYARYVIGADQALLPR